LCSKQKTKNTSTEGTRRTQQAIETDEREKGQRRVRPNLGEQLNRQKRAPISSTNPAQSLEPVPPALSEKPESLYTNANSVIGKMDLLRLKITTVKYHMIALTETWADSNIIDSELSIEGYVCYRQDRRHVRMSKGGGVLVYVKEDIHLELVKMSVRIEFRDAIAIKLYDHRKVPLQLSV
jgi:hypothetical protein